MSASCTAAAGRPVTEWILGSRRRRFAWLRPEDDESVECVAPTPVADAVSALTNLGCDITANAIAPAMKTAVEGADSAKLSRLGLKELAR